MLKTVLFGFMDEGYISLRKLEDNCKVNIRYKYLMDGQKPSYRTFGYFINKVIGGHIETLFNDITKQITTNDHVDLKHIYILMAQNSKPVPINIPGCGRRAQ